MPVWTFSNELFDGMSIAARSAGNHSRNSSATSTILTTSFVNPNDETWGRNDDAAAAAPAAPVADGTTGDSDVGPLDSGASLSVGGSTNSSGAHTIVNSSNSSTNASVLHSLERLIRSAVSVTTPTASAGDLSAPYPAWVTAGNDDMQDHMDDDDDEGGITILSSVPSDRDERSLVTTTTTASAGRSAIPHLLAVSPFHPQLLMTDGALSVSTTDSIYDDVYNDIIFSRSVSTSADTDSDDDDTPVSSPASLYGSSLSSAAASSSLSLHPSSLASSGFSNISSLSLVHSLPTNEWHRGRFEQRSFDNRSLPSHPLQEQEHQLSQQPFEQALVRISSCSPAAAAAPTASDETAVATWYHHFQTEQDWDAFHDGALQLLVALQDSVLLESDPDALLAALIQREEELFWQDDNNQAITIADTQRSKSSSKALWLLGELALVFASATMPLIGAAVLMSRNRR